MLALILILSMVCVDEIFVNFLKMSRTRLYYYGGQALLVIPFIYVNFISQVLIRDNFFINAGLLCNIALLAYLFLTKMDSKRFTNLLKKYSMGVGLYFLFTSMSIATLFHLNKWTSLTVILLCICYGMDTGAYFSGKKFGKNKLWPSVSPNKTREGLLGGAIASSLLSCFAWYMGFGKDISGGLGWKLPVIFALLGVMSQIGDLVQSKIKRQFGVKDSGSLIPGHGGVYDRVDSLLFVAPFFALIAQYFYFAK